MSRRQIFEVVLLTLSVVFAVAKAIGQLDSLPELSSGTEPDIQTGDFL